jgi:soluble lytic murein transglycosylase-like protein
MPRVPQQPSLRQTEQPQSSQQTEQQRAHNRYRASLTTLAVILFLALALRPVPSATASSNPDPGARLADAAQTRDLTRFLIGGSGDGRFHAFHAGDLATAANPAVASAQRRLSLLDPGPDVEEKRRFLHQMPYGTAIALAAERHHVDGLLLAAMVSVESGFSPRAISRQGARGLMQVIPDVAHDYGVKGDLLDPNVNIEVGSRFMSGLIKDYKGDLPRALAAYNAGPGVVDRYKGIPPYSETQGYVRQVLAQYADYHRKAGNPMITASVSASRSEAFRMDPFRAESSR